MKLTSLSSSSGAQHLGSPLNLIWHYRSSSFSQVRSSSSMRVPNLYLRSQDLYLPWAHWMQVSNRCPLSQEAGERSRTARVARNLSWWCHDTIGELWLNTHLSRKKLTGS